MKRKRVKVFAMFMLLLSITSISFGCTQDDNLGEKTLEGDTILSGENKETPVLPNTYIPSLDENGYITITMPITLLGGNTAEEIIAEFHNTEQYNHEGELAPTQRITDIIANEDGSVNYIFTQEQFEEYKENTYNAGRFEYAFGTFPSIQGAEYSKIDDNGIPWEVIVSVDRTEYEANQPISSLYATVWSAMYLGQYQVFSGISGDNWAVHVIVKDFKTGDIITENDFPTRNG